MEKLTENEPELFSQRFQTLSRWTVIIVLWVIIASIAMGKAGIANFMELIRERDILLQTINELQIQNQTIEENMLRLKSSRLAQERYIKQNFGYTERNEYIFQFSKKVTSDDSI